MTAAPEARSRGRSGLVYALVTLTLAALAVAWGGSPADRSWGIAVAWAVQAAAFWRLAAALDAPRDATRVWIGGMCARGGGLIVTGLLAYGGAATADLPIAYGMSMVVLLLVEAAWLLRRSGAGIVLAAGSAHGELDRTGETE